MKKFKFILPALVFVLTFAISFASVSDMFVVKYGYWKTPDGVCEELASNPCNNEVDFPCTVLSLSDGGPYQVYSSNVPQGSPVECTLALRNSTPQSIIIP